MELSANREDRGQWRIPFDHREPFDLAVSDENALRIDFRLDESSDGSDQVIVVVDSLRVQ